MATAAPPLVIEQISAALGRVPLFEGLDRENLARIARLVKARTLGGGEVLFRAGDEADRLYIIQSGTLELVQENGPAEVVRLEHAGAVIGASSLIAASRQTATARASERTNLLVISRADFSRLLARDVSASPIVLSLVKSLAAAGFEGYNQSLRSSLLPAEAPQTAEFEIAGSLACDEASRSGVLWDTFPFKGGGIVYAVLEANGSLLARAHLLVTARALLREIAASEERFERVLVRLNRAMFGSTGPDDGASIGVGLMHIAHVITFALAGAPAASLIRASGERVQIEQHGPAIGLFGDSTYGTIRAELEFADFAIMCTQHEASLLADVAQCSNDLLLDPVNQIASSFAARLLAMPDRKPGEVVAFVIAKRM
jgi:hypothetical protein